MELTVKSHSFDNFCRPKIVEFALNMRVEPVTGLPPKLPAKKGENVKMERGIGDEF